MFQAIITLKIICFWSNIITFSLRAEDSFAVRILSLLIGPSEVKADLMAR